MYICSRISNVSCVWRSAVCVVLFCLFWRSFSLVFKLRKHRFRSVPCFFYYLLPVCLFACHRFVVSSVFGGLIVVVFLLLSFSLSPIRAVVLSLFVPFVFLAFFHSFIHSFPPQYFCLSSFFLCVFFISCFFLPFLPSFWPFFAICLFVLNSKSVLVLFCDWSLRTQNVDTSITISQFFIYHWHRLQTNRWNISFVQWSLYT